MPPRPFRRPTAVGAFLAAAALCLAAPLAGDSADAAPPAPPVPLHPSVIDVTHPCEGQAVVTFRVDRWEPSSRSWIPAAGVRAVRIEARPETGQWRYVGQSWTEQYGGGGFVLVRGSYVAWRAVLDDGTRSPIAVTGACP